jgi:class 3 adenylate cyclase/HAMP domain-containing protein
MKIRGKIIVIVLPLLVTPLLFAGLISTLLARNGITGIATRFLQFKAEQIVTYAAGQWALLEENDLQNQPEFQAAAVEAIASFARGVVRSQSELIFAREEDAAIAFSVGGTAGESADPGLEGIDTEIESGWVRLTVGGAPRVAYALPFSPLGWTIYVSELESVFYESTESIIRTVAIVLAVSVVVSLLLLVYFSGYLTRPLRDVVDVMTSIIETNDLSQRVDVLYNDETGRLAHTFNILSGHLERAYDHIKEHAKRSAMLHIKEQKTRTMFQKYVPSDVIEHFFANPEKMLIGNNRNVSILFSDIRDFTTISEQMKPDQLVQTLNQYFTLMVDTIMSHDGIVDKYIGDAIMALFGNTIQRSDDAQRSLHAALDMVDSLRDFNRWQERRDLPPFRIGVGVNYGEVTVGNIGSDKKLDYTVIGDMVNVASRLEGLSKRYKCPVIISESIRSRITEDIDSGAVSVRLLDTVQVKGRTQGLRVYAAGRGLDEPSRQAWDLHNSAMDLYYQNEFIAAREQFSRVRKLIGGDESAMMMISRCDQYTQKPPGPEWNSGIVAMTDK